MQISAKHSSTHYVSQYYGQYIDVTNPIWDVQETLRCDEAMVYSKLQNDLVVAGLL